MTTTDQDLELASPEASAALLPDLPDLEQALGYFHQYVAPPTAINLSVAENVLLYEHSLEKQLDKVRLIPERYIQYSPSAGTPELRGRVAALLTRAFGPKVEPKHVFGVAGVSSALECLAFALKGLDPGDKPLKDGDGVLIPAPYWQGFNWSFETRPKLTCVPVNLPTTGDQRFRLTLALIKKTYEAQKRPPRLLVLTNPHNPLGVNYSKALLEEIYAWALKDTDMHIISDEIYCHSQIGGGKTKFTSAVALDAYRTYEKRVHVVWGFAKDFGLSGFRTGFVVSKNDAVARTMLGAKQPEPVQALPWFSPFDSLKTYTVDALLTATVNGTGTELYTTQAMKDYPKLLTDSFTKVKGALDKAGIEYVHRDGDNAAQFFWLDLTRYLGKRCPQKDGDCPVLPLPKSGVNDDEDWLHQYLAAKPTEVTLLPGTVMHSPAPGFFRMCYTARPATEIVAAIGRMATALGRLK